MSNCKIYRAINNETGKSYIGQTSQNLCRRFCGKKFGHYTMAFKLNSRTYFHGSLRKWGKDSFDIEILEENIAREELNTREIYWIKYFDTFKNGYNQTDGGAKGRILSSIARENISRGAKEGMKKFKNSDGYSDYIKNISDRMKGNIPHNKDKTLEELYGEERAVEIKDKMSKNMPCHRGSNNPMHGRSPYDIWVEKYGREKAEELKKNQYSSHKDKLSGVNGPRYGDRFTYEERYGKQRADEFKNKCSIAAKNNGAGKHCIGRKCINNGILCKRVKKEDLESYLSNGWILGTLPVPRDSKGRYIKS